METAVSNVAPMQRIKPLQVLVVGKIVNIEARKSERLGRSYYMTHVRTKPADEYSYPENFEVLSQKALGADGAVIQVLCDVRGRSRRTTYVDKSTGEARERIFYSVTLWQAAE